MRLVPALLVAAAVAFGGGAHRLETWASRPQVRAAAGHEDAPVVALRGSQDATRGRVVVATPGEPARALLVIVPSWTELDLASPPPAAPRRAAARTPRAPRAPPPSPV